MEKAEREIAFVRVCWDEGERRMTCEGLPFILIKTVGDDHRRSRVFDQSIATTADMEAPLLRCTLFLTQIVYSVQAGILSERKDRFVSFSSELTKPEPAIAVNRKGLDGICFRLWPHVLSFFAGNNHDNSTFRTRCKN